MGDNKIGLTDMNNSDGAWGLEQKKLECQPTVFRCDGSGNTEPLEQEK